MFALGCDWVGGGWGGVVEEEWGVTANVLRFFLFSLGLRQYSKLRF